MAENEAANRATDNRTYILYCIIGTLVPATAAIVAMRFYARKVHAKALGADDWVCLVSLVSSLLTTQQQTNRSISDGGHSALSSP